MTHSSLLSFFSLLCLRFSAVFGDESSLDQLIRQVVLEEEKTVDPFPNANHHFALFKTKFGKTYASQEEPDYCLFVLKSNMRHAKRHQLLDPTAEHGVTKFSDLTPSKFCWNHLGLKNPLKLPKMLTKRRFFRPVIFRKT